MNLSDLKIGDVGIVERPHTFWVNVLSGAIKLILEPSYENWGWHMFNVAWIDPVTGRMIQEAAGGVGARVVPLSTYAGSRVRFYRWLDTEPTEEGMRLFADDVMGFPYDNLVYCWTIKYYLIHKASFGHLHIPRFKDDKLMCWEDCSLCAWYFQKPWDDDDPEADAYALITHLINHAEYLGEVTI